MSRIVFALMICVSALCNADMFRPYDGDGTTPIGTYSSQQGMTCAYYNTAGSLKWENKGGDWLDANGQKQGGTPHAKARFAVSASPAVILMDVTGLKGEKGIVLRQVGGSAVRIGMREGANPPLLSVTLPDGSVTDLPAYADVNLVWSDRIAQQCAEWAGGSSPSATLSHALVMAFDIPPDAVSAVLKVTVMSAVGAGELQAFALRAPSWPTEAVIPYVPAADPGTIYHEPWDRPGGARPMDWWARAASPAPDAGWTHDGGLFPSPSSKAAYWANGDTTPVPAHDGNGILIQRGTGYLGSGLTWTNSPTRLAHGVSWSKVKISKLAGYEPDEAWLTYMVRFQNWDSFAKCEGGKLPGLSGRTDYCAGSATTANGLCGWSIRMSYKMQCDPNNPAWGYVIPYAYAYHGLMPGYYGNAWELAPAGRVKMGEWACIEQHVKVNTPGVIDGEIDVYINGRQVLRKTDLYLRGVEPPQGYGHWLLASQFPVAAGAATYTDVVGRTLWHNLGRSATGMVNPVYVDSQLGIDSVYMAIHNGGVTPVGFRPDGQISQAWMDEMRVSHQRAGCPAAEQSPPPPPPPPPEEQCGDGVDNDLDGQIDEGCAPPPPPPSELDLTRAALAKALSDLSDAQARIAALQGATSEQAGQIEALRTLAADAEARVEVAKALLRQINALTKDH